MPYEFGGKKYRSYKHPILEYILQKALAQSATNGKEPPDEIRFTYAQLNEAIAALGIVEERASKSNFTLDLLRRRNSWQSRVSDWIWEQGYDLDRIPEREARRWAGRLIKKHLRVEPYFEWPVILPEHRITLTNLTPPEIYPYLGRDEGALLSVLDYCDGLSWLLIGKPGTVKRVQHPKKWQPGEVDGLYLCSTKDGDVLYPVEAKALSTGDTINLVQLQSAFHTMRRKLLSDGLQIVPLAIEMTTTGMKIAEFRVSDSLELILFRCSEIVLDPVIESWKRRLQTRNPSGKN